jgi:hypothetical protein
VGSNPTPSADSHGTSYVWRIPMGDLRIARQSHPRNRDQEHPPTRPVSRAKCIVPATLDAASAFDKD